MKQTITIKRAYESADGSDGYRVYVDRLWPRGLSHENFHYDMWSKEIAPSTDLREWFHANMPNGWPEFERRYRLELSANPDFSILKEAIKDKPKVTLLYSSRDTMHNNAIVLRDMLLQQ